MVIFNSYVKLPEGNVVLDQLFVGQFVPRFWQRLCFAMVCMLEDASSF